ncbi:MAG: polysaccharide deacetylase family protein [Bacillota bacterium]|nr:polysaccharide deacetylase family protein [Bacillota bacterium]
MLARKLKLVRPGAVTIGLVIGLCFIVGMGGVLLTNRDLIPWLRGNGDGTGDGGSQDPTGDPGGSEYVIYAGQVLRIPAGGPARPTFETPTPPRTVTRIEAGTKRVALTFDCGWFWEPAGPLLDVLKRYDLQVTFFPRGKWIENNPDLVRRMLAEGHEVGNHSYTHPEGLVKQTPEKIDAEIAQGKQALVAVGGEESFVPLYRPPYGAHGDAVSQALEAHGYGWVVMWQVDSLDWMETSGVQAIIDRVLTKVEDGGIVLMHVGRIETAQALPAIIDDLLGRGYDIVRVTDLLSIRNDGGADTAQYVVQRGDTLYGLARRFETTVDRLLALNPEVKRSTK